MHKAIEAYLLRSWESERGDKVFRSIRGKITDFVKNAEGFAFESGKQGHIIAEAHMALSLCVENQKDILCEHLLNWGIEKTLLLADISPEITSFLDKRNYDLSFWGRMLIKYSPEAYNEFGSRMPFKFAYLSEMRAEHLRSMHILSLEFLTRLDSLSWKKTLSELKIPDLVYISAISYRNTLNIYREFFQNKHTVDVNGVPPLFTMIRWRMDHEAILMIENGASLSYNEKIQTTPLEIAENRNAVNIVKAIKSALEAKPELSGRPLRFTAESKTNMPAANDTQNKQTIKSKL